MSLNRAVHSAKLPVVAVGEHRRNVPGVQGARIP